MAMSLVQGGSGFPFLAPPMYDYLCGREISTIEVCMQDVPNLEVLSLLEKVLQYSHSQITIEQHTHACINRIFLTID